MALAPLQEATPWSVVQSQAHFSPLLEVRTRAPYQQPKPHPPEKVKNELDTTSLLLALSKYDKRAIFPGRSLRRHVLGHGQSTELRVECPRICRNALPRFDILSLHLPSRRLVCIEAFASRGSCSRDRQAHRSAVRHRAEQVYGAGRARRSGTAFRHTAHACRVSLQDCQRRPANVLRPEPDSQNW